MDVSIYPSNVRPEVKAKRLLVERFDRLWLDWKYRGPSTSLRFAQDDDFLVRGKRTGNDKTEAGPLAFGEG
jgi:hypothetical protein